MMATNTDCFVCKHGGRENVDHSHPQTSCPACGRLDCIHESPLHRNPLDDAPGEGGWYSTLSPQPIEVIEAWRAPFHLANVIKYVARWERKGGIEDLKKALWYLDRFISRMEDQVAGKNI